MRITSGSGFLGTSLLVFLIAAFITLQHVHQASPNEWLLVVDAEGAPFISWDHPFDSHS
jgi:hypothetical protein